MPAPIRYHWIPISASHASFLQPLASALDVPCFQVWTEADLTPETFTRVACGGLVTAMAECDGRPVAIAWSDFRIRSATFDAHNSRRFVAFLEELTARPSGPVPLLYFVQSAGISLMAGRTVFPEAFALWPALLRFSERHLLLTCADGQCLGLAPLLFGLGHYRIGVAGRARLNLTGPEVIRMFFGTGVDFARDAAVEQFEASTDLVHELVPGLEAACARFRDILSSSGTPSEHAVAPPAVRLTTLLATLFDHPPVELVPGWCDRLRLFLGRRGGHRLGVFLNPPGHADNLITVRTLDKYAAGLDLFRALGVPILSLLDSPGFDPRFEQSAANNFRRMLYVGEKIIRYPHGCMGIIVGRCFGGAATLLFPRVFGGRRVVALRGSRVGTMDERIVDRLLAGRPRLHAEWRAVAARQTPGLEDLVAAGAVDAVVDVTELGAEVDGFLTAVRGPVLVTSPGHRSPRLRAVG